MGKSKGERKEEKEGKKKRMEKVNKRSTTHRASAHTVFHLTTEEINCEAF